LLTRSFYYSLLGAVCVYFDLLDGTSVLIISIICCQWTASAVTIHLKHEDNAGISWVRKISYLIVNLVLVSTGAVFAIMARLIGYSFVTGNNLLTSLAEWMNTLAFRISGDLVEIGKAGSSSTTVEFFLQLKIYRLFYPFYGILNNYEACLFYVLGLLGWLFLLPICLKMAKRHALPLDILTGFVSGGLCVPCWYFLFKQHTIIHLWMTGRLLVPFCGLGITSALTMYAVSNDLLNRFNKPLKLY
jgi:hypothetical protein